MDSKKDVGPGYSPVGGSDRLFRLLNAVLSSEGELKQAAEQATQKLEAIDDYPILLTEVVLNPNWSRNVRIFASTKLKKFVETHWCATDEDFQPPEMNSKNKTKVKELLLNGLSETTIEVKTAVADIIGSIVPWDWPDDWPEFIDTLVNCLNGESKMVHGALLVLNAFRADSTDDLAVHHAVILREVNRIFAGDNYSDEIRCMACNVLCKMVGEIAQKEQPDIIRRYLRPAVLLFCKTSMQSWTSRNCSIQLKIDILNALIVHMECVPKYIADFLADMLPVIWETLIECAKDYQAYVVNAEDGQRMETESKSVDANHATATGNYSENLVEALIEFLEHLMTGEDRYSLYITDCQLLNDEWFYLQDCFSTPQALRHLIMLMEVTEKQINSWEKQVDDFVKKEEMHSFINDDICQTGQQLIENIRRRNGAGANSLTVVIMKYLEEENEMRIDGRSGVRPDKWKSHEAFLLAFSLMKGYIITKKNGSSSRYDVVPLLENIVLADLNDPASHPLLVGRCLILGGLYSPQMPKKLASAFLEATVNGLQGSRPILVRICAACAISLWYYRDRSDSIQYDKMLTSHVPDLSKGLFALVNKFKSAEVHKLVLRGIASLMPYNEAFTASMAGKIYSLTMRALLKYRVMNLTHQWPYVFKELTLNTKCIPLLQKRLKRDLLSMMTNTPSEEPQNGNAALKIVTILVKHSPLPLSYFLIDALFTKSCNFISSTLDFWNIVDGIELIHTYISVAPEEVIYYQDKNGKYGAQYVLQAIVPALNNNYLTTTTKEVCRILILLTTKSWYEIRENVDELLKTLLRCMRSEKFAHVIRKLLMVFAHLIHKRSDAVFKLLADAPSSAEHKSSLECVISEGFWKHYPMVVGEERETMKLALGKVLEHGVTNPSSPLHQITVTDRLERPIPLLVKICRLFVDHQASGESGK